MVLFILFPVGGEEVEEFDAVNEAELLNSSTSIEGAADGSSNAAKPTVTYRNLRVKRDG